MPKSRAQSEAKLQAALDSMRRLYSTTEFREWNSASITRAHRIGATFPTVLAKMGAIETDYGMVKLTPRMEGLRASTIRKQMNEYSHSYKKARTVPTVRASAPTQSTDFSDLVIALKAKLKQEVMSELLASLK
jgi:hypothetical protein